jgi:hypothetical protein
VPARVRNRRKNRHTPAEVAARPEDYERFGLSETHVEEWEDGAHTDGRPRTYEWWYFDAHLDDGTKVVVVFMTKDLSTPHKPLTPLLRINLDLPDGRSFERVQTFSPRKFSMATETADVRMAKNRFVGDLSSYRITAAIENIKVDFTLDSQIAPWRPHTGHLVFGRGRNLEFNWLPSVPQGRVSGTYKVNGTMYSATGVGYHDHNWGNVGLPEIVHHWYWARGQAGPYSVISSSITAHERYGFESFPVFMLAKNGTVVVDDAARVTFETLGPYIDPHTRKPVANVTRYTYTDGHDRYVVTYTRHRDLSVARFLESSPWPKRLLARLLRFDGAYLRFAGELRIEHIVDGTLVDQFVDEALWELMYFGHARP